jgi:hypothetical protein
MSFHISLVSYYFPSEIVPACYILSSPNIVEGSVTLDGKTFKIRTEVTSSGGGTGSSLKAIVASATQSARPGDTVTLNGSRSTGNIASYNWEQTGGFGQVSLNNSDTKIATFSAPTTFGDYTFRLIVTEAGGTGKTDSADTTVTISDKPPVTKPTEGHIKSGGWGANLNDRAAWHSAAMANTPGKFKVVDSAGKTVADMFSSQDTANNFVAYYRANPDETPVDASSGGGGGDGGGGGGTGTPVQGTQIYTAKTGGYTRNTFDTSGGPAASDGLRFNIDGKADVVNRETTYVFTVTNEPTKFTDKPTITIKAGSHGKKGETCQLYEARYNWDNGPQDCRTEGPHPSYHSCNKSAYVLTKGPKFPRNKKVAMKFTEFVKDNTCYAQWWYDFDNAGAGPYTKYAELHDSGNGACGMKPILTTIPGAAGIIQDTLRGNGMDAQCHSATIVEIEVPDAPKGSLHGMAKVEEHLAQSGFKEFEPTCTAAED